jgi:hypothetical protein
MIWEGLSVSNLVADLKQIQNSVTVEYDGNLNLTRWGWTGWFISCSSSKNNDEIIKLKVVKELV